MKLPFPLSMGSPIEILGRDSERFVPKAPRKPFPDPARRSPENDSRSWMDRTTDLFLETSDRLSALETALRPDPADLERAPVLEGWMLAVHPDGSGWIAAGRPAAGFQGDLAGKELFVSKKVISVDVDRFWVRDADTLYRLGEPFG